MDYGGPLASCARLSRSGHAKPHSCAQVAFLKQNILAAQERLKIMHAMAPRTRACPLPSSVSVFGVLLLSLGLSLTSYFRVQCRCPSRSVLFGRTLLAIPVSGSRAGKRNAPWRSLLRCMLARLCVCVLCVQAACLLLSSWGRLAVTLRVTPCCAWIRTLRVLACAVETMVRPLVAGRGRRAHAERSCPRLGFLELFPRQGRHLVLGPWRVAELLWG